MKHLRGWGVVFCWVAASLVAGCGGDSEGDSDDDEQATCPVASCGGDVVGTWNVDSFCISFVESPIGIEEPECQDILRGFGANADGTLTFTAEGMATSNLTLQFVIDIGLTDACSQALGGTN